MCFPSLFKFFFIYLITLIRTFINSLTVHYKRFIDIFIHGIRFSQLFSNKSLKIFTLIRFAHLFQVTETFEMEAQPQLLLLQKTMLVAEGVGRTLDPTVNMWALARPLIEEWIILNRGPEARLRDMVTDTVSTLEQLPQLLGRAEAVADALSGGRPLGSQYGDAPSGGIRSDWMLYGLIAIIVVLLFTSL